MLKKTHLKKTNFHLKTYFAFKFNPIILLKFTLIVFFMLNFTNKYAMLKNNVLSLHCFLTQYAK